MRKLMAALAVGMAVTGGSAASAQNPEDALTVTLHITNYAAISPRELAAAEAYAMAIYPCWLLRSSTRFSVHLRMPTRPSDRGCVARSRERSTTHPGSPASIGCRPVIAPRPRYSIGAVRKASDSRTRAVRRGPRGSSFNCRWISI